MNQARRCMQQLSEGCIHDVPKAKVLFTYEKILDFATGAFSFVCDKYYPIMD